MGWRRDGFDADPATTAGKRTRHILLFSPESYGAGTQVDLETMHIAVIVIGLLCVRRCTASTSRARTRRIWAQKTSSSTCRDSLATTTRQALLLTRCCGTDAHEANPSTRMERTQLKPDVRIQYPVSLDAFPGDGACRSANEAPANGDIYAYYPACSAVGASDVLHMQMVHFERMPARQAKFAETARPLSAASRRALDARGVKRLFLHQAQV